jgi:hypothetical protein
LTGAWLSIAASVIMATLLVLELSAFLRVQTATEMVVDRSPAEELLKVTFNVSFPALGCEFATLDVSDTLGTVRERGRGVAWLAGLAAAEGVWEKSKHFALASSSSSSTHNLPTTDTNTDV